MLLCCLPCSHLAGWTEYKQEVHHTKLSLSVYKLGSGATHSATGFHYLPWDRPPEMARKGLVPCTFGALWDIFEILLHNITKMVWKLGLSNFVTNHYGYLVLRGYALMQGVAKEMERSYASAKLKAWFSSGWPLPSFSPFLKQHPEHGSRTRNQYSP